MTPRIAIDDQTFHQLQQVGELQVESAQGVPIVIMTVGARADLQKQVYDDSDWSNEEMLAIAAKQLDDPQGWGAPEMDVYDRLYGDRPSDHEQDPAG